MSVPNDCSALGKEVEVGSIEVELKKLWEADSASTNASLVNFAVYSEDVRALAQNSDIVREITREHACRALLIGIDREEEKASTRSWVTAHCNIANGNKSVCCEQIAFHLSGRVSGRLSNTIFAHLHSDLPLIFWWQGELTERFQAPLYSWIDRLVVDSAAWQSPREHFQTLERVMEEQSLVVQDLSWTRTYHLRLSIASFFDDPVAQTAIPTIEKVKITTSPDSKVSGIQLLAWIAEQCEWKDAQELISLDEAEGAYHFENGSGGTVQASITTEPNSASISCVEIEAGSVKLRVTHQLGQSLLHLHSEVNGNTSEQSAPADSAEVVGLVRDQLSRGGKNSLFRKVFPRFLQLLRK